jgi:hypothetical protein
VCGGSAWAVFVEQVSFFSSFYGLSSLHFGVRVCWQAYRFLRHSSRLFLIFYFFTSLQSQKTIHITPWVWVSYQTGTWPLRREHLHSMPQLYLVKPSRLL